jgi:hypothetical protein
MVMIGSSLSMVYSYKSNLFNLLIQGDNSHLILFSSFFAIH